MVNIHIQFGSVAQSCPILCDPMNCSLSGLPCPSPTPKLMSIQSVMPSNHFILCCPLLLLPQIFLSIRVFSNELALRIRWPKFWSLSFNISPSNEHPGLISFRIDCLDLLADQGTLNSLLQHHSSKASFLLCSAFFTFQLSHPYMTTGKTTALTQFSSVQFSCSVMSESLQPHESQYSRPPCPSPTPEFTQTHVHWVGDAIQLSHPLSTPSLPAPNPSQHQGLFQWVYSSREVAKVLEFQLQYPSFQWTPRTDLLQDGLVGSPCRPRDSQESSPTPQFKSINSSALSFLHIPTLTSIHDHWKNHSLD